MVYFRMSYTLGDDIMCYEVNYPQICESIIFVYKKSSLLKKMKKMLN